MTSLEPCENCGSPVVQGAPRGCPPEWFERIDTYPRDYRPHTPERCRSARQRQETAR